MKGAGRTVRIELRPTIGWATKLVSYRHDGEYIREMIKRIRPYYAHDVPGSQYFWTASLGDESNQITAMPGWDMYNENVRFSTRQEALTAARESLRRAGLEWDAETVVYSLSALC